MRATLSLLFVLLSTGAYAHTGVGTTSGLAMGFAHPLGGLDHILAMVAVGVFAAVLGGRALLLVPLAFVGMMIVGFLFGAGGISVPFVELGIALSSIVIGAIVASGRTMPVVAAMGLVGAFASFHGLAHGAEMPASAGALSYATGFVCATVLLHVVGVAATIGAKSLVQRFGANIARVGGGALALGGVGLLGGW